MTATAIKQFRLLIVDDEDLARQRVHSLLAPRSDFEVVGECATGAEAVRAIRELQPDVVLLDVQMPELDGFDVISEIGAQNMPLVIFATAFDEYAIDAFEVGAVDYLLKPVDEERFNRTLDRAARRLRQSGDDTTVTQMSALLRRINSLTTSAGRFAGRCPCGATPPIGGKA